MNRGKWLLLLSLLAMVLVTIAPGPDGDIFRFMENQTVRTGEEVRGTVFVIGGDLHIEKDATVTRDAVVLFGNLILEGRVNGSAGSAFGDTKLVKGASVIGDCGTFYGRMTGDRSVVLGEVDVLEPAANFDSGNLLQVITTTVVAVVVVMYLISCLIYLLFPKRAEVIATSIQNSLGRRFLIGFLVNLTIIPVGIVLVITVVGIFVIPFVALLYIALNLLGGVALALAVGRRITGELKEGAKENPYIYMLSGVLIVFVISIIPVIGWLIYLGAGCIALGATIDTKLGEAVD